jgi:Cytochrome c7 and related cytochrome c
MSQLFPRSANATARMSLAALLAVALTGVWVVFTLMRSGWVTGQNEFVEQPVQFSHAHHVGGVGLDCRYCHTSVESSSFAGIPPTKTCMNCHSQIWTNAPILEPVRASFRNNVNLNWIRVHDLPDFVYFNHQIHVKQGVGCVTCHGRIDQMPLTYQAQPLLMEWCLSCHRAPENHLRPRDQVFNMSYVPDPEEGQLAIGTRLKKEYNVASVEHLTSCSTCHR